MNLSRNVAALFPAILFFLLTGCSPMVKDGQPGTTASSVVLRPGETVGQTFTARDRGLNGVEVFLSPEGATTGEIRLHLRRDPQSTTDIAMGTLDAQIVTKPGFYRFYFAPQRNSRQQDYYLTIEFPGSGALHVGTAPGDAYLDGALYQNDSPIDAQMSFRLAYDPVELSIGLAALMLTWLKVSAIAVFLFVLPGWALLAILFPGWGTLSWGERLALAGGVSIALYPILLLWTALFGVRLGSLYAWIPAVAAVGVLVWRNRKWRPREIGESWRAWRKSGWVLSDLVFACLIALIIGVRFWVIRSLDVPMWGDSYQHTMIAQLIVDHGGLFDSWQPYADLQTFTYHFGFHSAVAAFHWITDVNLSRATLWVGQIFNALAVFAVYPLAMRISSGNRWAGVLAVLIAGLLLPMPMFYMNWGRYTQLAGQVVLPAAIYLAWVVLETRSRYWRLLGATWIVWGGLALTHYRILIFGILFFIGYLLVNIGKKPLRDFIGKTILMGVGGGLIFLPWFYHTFEGKITQWFAQKLMTLPSAVSAFTREYNTIGDMSAYLPVIFWGLLFVCIGWGLWRRDRNTALFSLWWACIVVSANPQWLGLSGEGVLSNFAVLIAAYIPASVLIGTAISWLIGERHRAISHAIPALCIILSLAYLPQRVSDLQLAQGALATSPDLRAATWIQANIPPSSRFLVNTFFAYGNAVVVGSDGGWWLPLLAHRQTILPPLNYGTEEGVRKDYREWINAVPFAIQKYGISQPETIELLKAHGITHVYIGQRQGHVNYAGSVLQPGQLLTDTHFQLVYHQDRVWIFQLTD